MDRKDKPKPPLDDLSAQLQASLKKGRPRPFRVVVVAGLLAAAGLGLLAWLLLPRPKPPPLIVVACDVLTVVGKERTGQAWVDARGEDRLKVRLEGQLVQFQKPPLPWEQPQVQTGKTDSRGRAEGPGWKLDKPGAMKYQVSLAVHPDQQGPARDEAFIYAWDPPTPLLLVTLDTLVDPVLLVEKHIQDIPLSAEARSVLRLASQGRQVVYLAWNAQGPLPYQKARSWTHHQRKMGGLPDGPVLGSWEVRGQGGNWGPTIKSILDRQQGIETLAAAGTKEAAQILQTEGCRTVLLGQEGPVQGVVVKKSWAEAADWLTKKE